MLCKPTSAVVTARPKNLGTFIDKESDIRSHMLPEHEFFPGFSATLFECIFYYVLYFFLVEP